MREMISSSAIWRLLNPAPNSRRPPPASAVLGLPGAAAYLLRVDAGLREAVPPLVDPPDYL